METIKQKALPMLLLTINCSISNKNNHLTLDELYNLIINIKQKQTNLSALEKYAIDMMKTEASKEEIAWYMKDYNIPQENIDYILSLNPYAR